MPDSLSDRYAELLTGSYDCVDRIVLNAFFRMGHGPGGFRVWWQKLTGSVETLDNAHLMRLAGRFSRRVRAWAKASGIPLIDCRPGERKHDIAEEHLKKTTIKQGVFLILVARAQAPVWDVRPKHRLERIFKLHCGKLTLKIYTKGERVLRIEAVLHNSEELQCGRSLDRFPRLVMELRGILERFLNALSLIDQCFISAESLQELPKPSVVGKAKVGGIDFNKERMRRAGEAVLALAASASSFTASCLAEQVCSATGQTSSEYGPRHAAYDLKKLRAKNMVQRIGRSRRYEATPSGLKAMAALVTLRHHVILPLLASTMNHAPSRGAQNPTPLDQCYASLRKHMQDLLQQLGVAA